MTQLASFDLLVSYAQLVVFDIEIENPFNDWTPEHNNQGFSWRPSSVSFATLDSLPTIIEVYLCRELRLRANTVRAIRVPFTVEASGFVGIASVGSEQTVAVPSGDYALTFEHSVDSDGQKMCCVLTFVPTNSGEIVSPAILLADSAITIPAEYVMTAWPAT